MSQKNVKRKFRRKKRIKVLPLITIVVFCIMVVGFLVGFMSYSNAQKPTSRDSEIVYFNIETGTSVTTILNELENDGIIKDAFMAKVYARLNNLTQFCAGTFELDKASGLETILTILNDPTKAQTDTVMVTFIEGDWVKHIAKKISEATILEEQDILNTWNDETYVRSLMSDYPFLTNDIFNENSRYLLEGYLFPDTYEFFIDTTVDEVTRRILDNTLTVYNGLVDDLDSTGYSIHQWFTLASIVQYEASKVEDMKLVASVFNNRLAIGMPLQSSVTVCYALDVDKDTDWQQCEVNPTYDSPYNTYMVNGLPPGPILNPGKDALDAVLHPAQSDYYYFMADVYGDGTVYFSKTLEEHEALVNKYLR